MATRLPIEDVASTARVTVAALHAVLLVEEPVAMAEILLDLERARMIAEDLRTRTVVMNGRLIEALDTICEVANHIEFNDFNGGERERNIALLNDVHSTLNIVRPLF